MTTKTKTVFNQDSNYVALENPVKDLKAAIENHKMNNKSQKDFAEVEKAFEVIWKMVFSSEKLI